MIFTNEEYSIRNSSMDMTDRLHTWGLWAVAACTVLFLISFYVYPTTPEEAGFMIGTIIGTLLGYWLWRGIAWSISRLIGKPDPRESARWFAIRFMWVTNIISFAASLMVE